jgi:hypothetical protein
MLQLTPQTRILVSVEPVDFRNYAESEVMQSRCGWPTSAATGPSHSST